jgi:hypothetical protein
MKIAFACEDPLLDQYIVRPVLTAMLKDLGKPKARLFAITNPRTKGFHDLVARACDMVSRYGQEARAIIFVIDTDCDDGREGHMNKPVRLANALAKCDELADKAVIVAAVQEVEVWAVWGIRNELPDPWSTVLDECHPKELYFEPQLTAADKLLPDGGRSRLIKSSLSSGWTSLSTGCSELADLRTAVEPLVV